jgi:hypothetical protein
MKVIFLDVDGVLNNKDTKELTPGGWLGVSDILVERLQRVAAATDAKVVLTSTWKNADESELNYLYKKLDFCKPIAFTKEDEMKGSFYRGGGIIDYLTAHQDIEQFVILDDYIFDFEEQDLLDHLVWTNEKEGLTEEKAQQAIKILNGELNTQDYIDEIKADIHEWGYHR